MSFKSIEKGKRFIARAIAVLWLAASPLFIVAPAHALTAFSNDYPYGGLGACNYDSSLWCDSSGSWYSSLGYAYRYCTDGAAYWVQKYTGKNISGWGNANTWDTAAVSAGYEAKDATSNSIEPGDIAQSDTMSSYGHVGMVTEVNKSGSNITSIKVAEMNHNSDGNAGVYTYTNPAVWHKFIDVNGQNKGLNNETLTGGSTLSQNVIRIKKSTFGSSQEVFTATNSAVYISSWGSGWGIQQDIIPAPNGETIVDIDKINQPDGNTQNLYIATTTGVYEVWWNGSGYSNPAKIVNLANTKRVVADLKQEGTNLTHRLYVLANDGPYEYWWRDGTGVSGGYRLWNINNGFDIVKSAAPTGEDEVFVATKGETYMMKWPVNNDIQRKVVTTLADTVAIDKQNIGTTELFYTATKTGVHETWWDSSHNFSNPAKIVTVTSGDVVAIKKSITGSTQQLYVATPGKVTEYYWGSGINGIRSGTIVTITQNNIVDIDKSLSGSYQQLYTAHGNFVVETWWGDGSLHNDEIKKIE